MQEFLSQCLSKINAVLDKDKGKNVSSGIDVYQAEKALRELRADIVKRLNE